MRHLNPVLAQGVVVKGQHGTDRQSCAFPSLAVLPTGRWLCGFRAACTKTGNEGQHVAITWSDDGGRSWSEPVSPFPVPRVDDNPGQFRSAALTALSGNDLLATLCWVDYSDTSRPFFNEATEGLLDTRIFIARSHDGGRTWTDPARLDTAPFRPPTPPTGPVLVLPDGQWVCQFELNKPYNDPAPWRHGSVLMFSADQGRTWPNHAVVSCDPANRVFYWDQRPGLLANGCILDLFWTYDRVASRYLNIHGRESRDHGRSWSALWDTGVPGQPAPPVSLPDGRIALVYMDRTAAPVLKLRTSHDGGRTWPPATELILYESPQSSQTRRKQSLPDAWAEMEKFSVGLPATATTREGDLAVVYYAGPKADHTDINWVRVRP